MLIGGGVQPMHCVAVGLEVVGDYVTVVRLKGLEHADFPKECCTVTVKYSNTFFPSRLSIRSAA